MARKGEPEEHPIGSLALMAVGLSVMVGDLRYGFGTFDNPGAGFLPFFAGLLIFVFSVVTFVQSLRAGWCSFRELWAGKRWPQVLIVTVLLLLYSAFLRDLGFLVSTLCLMTLLFGLVERHSWKMILFEAMTATVASYILFHICLGAQLPQGLLGL